MLCEHAVACLHGGGLYRNYLCYHHLHSPLYYGRQVLGGRDACWYIRSYLACSQKRMTERRAFKLALNNTLICTRGKHHGLLCSP